MKWTWTVMLVCAAGGASAGTIFNVVDLGSLGGSAAQAFGLNASGEAVGSAANSFGYTHAFSSFGNGLFDLTFNSAASEGIASGINSLGEIAGTQFIAGQSYATIWINGSPQSIGAAGSYATAINDSGKVTGMLPDGHTFISSNGSIVEFNSMTWSSGYGINSSGQVAGSGQISPGVFRGFLWTPTTGYVPIGTFGGTSSYATVINDSGQVAGSAQLASGYQHAFLWSNGAMQDLGTLGLSSFAYGVNDMGSVVGYSYVGGAQHAFLYENGKMMDLNNLIVASPGWVLEAAYAINGSNQIVGTGLLNGVEHAFRLDDPPAPDARFNSIATPEPDNWVIALIGLGLIVSSRLRFRPRLPRRRRTLPHEPRQ